MEMCGDRWKDQSVVLFLIYTSVLITRLASKNEEKTLRAIHPIRCLYLAILNRNSQDDFGTRGHQSQPGRHRMGPDTTVRE